MVVDVCFFGKPKVSIDGIPIEMEQKKPQALLLYILFNGSATRDELAELLWCDYAPEKARSNLRNSLYKLKMIVGEDVLTTKGHSFVSVSENITLRRDIDLFITENSRDQLLSLTSYIFLEHFYVKNCPEFERWIGSMRTAYEKLMVKRLSKELQTSMANKTEHRAEDCAIRILEIDPYQEEACQALMHINMVRSDYNTATACYQILKRRLKDDLGVEPTLETENLFHQLQELKKTVQPSDANFGSKHIQGIVDTLNCEYRNFCLNRPASHCILSGDIGMGKSNALQIFMQGLNPEELVLVQFRLTYREVAYYGAEYLIDALYRYIGYKEAHGSDARNSAGSRYYFKQVEEFFHHLKKSGKKIVLVLQNLEAIDWASMDIFLACLFEAKTSQLLIFGEYCLNFEDSSRFLKKISVIPNFRILDFPLLDERDSTAYLRKCLAPCFDQDDILKEGYECSGGNLLLLREYAHNVANGSTKPYTLSSEGMQMVDKLLFSLTPDEYQLLEVLAVLGSAEIETLTQIMQIPSIMVIRLLDALSRRGWLCEVEENPHLLLRGRFQLIQDLLYNQMPRYKRTELHRLAAEYYETKHKQHPKDLFYLTQLRDHCHHIASPGREIYYNILCLEYTLDYFDEFFPTIVDDTIQHPERWIISRTEVFQLFHQYNNDLEMMADDLPPAHYCELRMKLDYLQGRAMIRSGEREEAMVYISRLIDMAQKIDRSDMLIKGYVEASCYALRAEDTSLMKEYLARACAIDKLETYEKEHGVILRLQGYLEILSNHYEVAMDYLKQSIAIFEQPKLRSTNYYNIAGAYDYLSLNSRRQGKLDEALVYIHKSIDLCIEKNVQKSLDLFYEDCGYIHFLKGDYNAAEQYFMESIELYEQFDTFWLRSIAESGMAMIHANRGNNNAALEHFRRAEVFSQKEMAHEELVCLDEARRLLKEKKIL